MLEHFRTTIPSVVKDIGTEALPLAAVQKALALLLRERVWPRDLAGVFEAMIDAATRDPRELAEAARRVIVPAQLRRRETRTLEPLLLDPEFERELDASWSAAAPDPQLAVYVRQQVEGYLQDGPAERAAVVCTAGIRPVLADFLLRSGLAVGVYGYAEIPPEMNLLPRTILKRPQAPAA